MSTKLNFSITCQSMLFFQDLKIETSEKLINFSEKHTNTARFIGLPIVLCFSLLSLAETVSTIGETLIKGFANIGGSLFSKDYHLLKGIKQIVYQLPVHLINDVILFPLITGFEILGTPIYMLISPTSALRARKKEVEGKTKMMEIIVHNQPFQLPPHPIAKEITNYYILGMKHRYT
jgi:hypothetical protein